MTIPLTLWHAMSGAFGIPDFFRKHIDRLVHEFNRSQSDYRLDAVYKGHYAETVRAGIAAFRAGNPPHLLQSWEVGAGTLLAANCTVNASELMQRVGASWSPGSYLSGVFDYYKDAQERLLCFPFNLSTPILYYNKNAFARAGLDPDAPPATWAQVGEAAQRLRSSGIRHAYSTTRHRWVHLDNFGAWHDVEFATQGNGLDGPGSRLCFDSPLHVRHIQMLADWAREGLFTHFGPLLEAERPFMDGEVGMLTHASAPYAGIVRRAGFDVGVAPLPHHGDVAAAPRNTLPAGSAFWAMAGKTPDEYRGVARFVQHVTRPEMQARRHRAIGYQPVSAAAYELTRDPSTELAFRQLTPPRATRASRGIRLGQFEQIDRIASEELEAVWSAQRDARAALGRAVERGNDVLARFEREGP